RRHRGLHEGEDGSDDDGGFWILVAQRAPRGPEGTPILDLDAFLGFQSRGSLWATKIRNKVCQHPEALAGDGGVGGYALVGEEVGGREVVDGRAGWRVG